MLRYLKLIFEGYKKGKRIKDVYITENDRLLENFILSFESYDKKFMLFLSLFVIHKYLPQNFRTFLTHLKENLDNRKEYFKFKLYLQNPYEYIKKDIEYLIENHIKLDENEILKIYQDKKISFYTFYMLLKDKKVGIVSSEILKSINYILQFLKIKIDDNWYSSVYVKDELF